MCILLRSPVNDGHDASAANVLVLVTREAEEPDTGDTEFQDPSVYSTTAHVGSGAQHCAASIGRCEAPASASPAFRIPVTAEGRTIAAERLTTGKLRPDSTKGHG